MQENLNSRPKVLLAMSGGVDSSVAAFLLQRAGYEVVGITLQMWSYEKTYSGKESAKPDNDFIVSAQHLASKLNIEHHLVDIQDEFEQTIIQNFVEEYFAGRTPNPCVLCNPTMKFGALFRYAEKLGCEKVATGHYLRLKKENGRFFVSRGKDVAKDQSYVLWKMSQAQLSRCLFPLGEFAKEEVKAHARAFGIVSIAEQRESYDVCFIPTGDYRSFLQMKCPAECEALRGGIICDKNGTWLGKHRGYPFYTIGQRKGLEVAVGHPIYVTRLDAEKNKVILGEKEDLLSQTLFVTDYNIAKYETLPKNFRALVRIRYKDAGTMALITHEENNSLRCDFDTPVSAVTPGQSAVFYDGEDVVGGGVIVR
ncbi:MAG: tRNA 2-thiouridine(34) synthase MnmA [Bacteroidales bacterium]|jgi:tRNA-specific 2-thiouridylase|nr:tRNA 2-thiouridine(34) synthase MnmA [Bacteroidales bacterium]